MTDNQRRAHERVATKHQASSAYCANLARKAIDAGRDLHSATFWQEHAAYYAMWAEYHLSKLIEG